MSGYEKMGTPVEYRDQYFDSLTEARWAAYFDAAGMPFVREPETFEFLTAELKFGDHVIPVRRTLYTPDYFLAEQDIYVEVKNGNIDYSAVSKLSDLVMRSGKPGLLIDGKPGTAAFYAFSPNKLPGPRYHNKRHDFDCDFFYPPFALNVNEVRYPQLHADMRAIYQKVVSIDFVSPSTDVQDAALSRRKSMQMDPTTLPPLSL